MCCGSKWMLMWRSGPCCSSAIVPLSIATVRILVVAVGRLRPPFADDIAHYSKLIAGHARLELIEVREDEQVEKRIPERAFVSLLDDDGRGDGLGALQPLPRGAPDGRRATSASSSAAPTGCSSTAPTTASRWGR